MNKFKMFLLVGILSLGSMACSDTARTSTAAPDSTDEAIEVPDVDAAVDSKQDATSDVRQNQLDSDIRAREERNNITGGDAERADGDLASEVRSKLEANLPASALTIEAEEGTVKIVGTVPTQEQFDRIEPLAKEIKGVQTVVNEAVVAPAQPES
ncbi:MAG: BON domain-containing protein [Geitlerinemataceae cyanobacterium]